MLESGELIFGFLSGEWLMNDVSMLCEQFGQQDPTAAEDLLPLVYDELRRLAARRLADESPGQTLQATALVHEAYIRLVNAESARHWDHRGHFFAAAAEAMRRILVERARRKHRLRHGGQWRRVDMNTADLAERCESDDLVALDEALRKLHEHAPVNAQLVVLRYFGGMTIEQAAAALQISRATAHRYWVYARAWLYRQMAEDRRVVVPTTSTGDLDTGQRDC